MPAQHKAATSHPQRFEESLASYLDSLSALLLEAWLNASLTRVCGEEDKPPGRSV